MKTVRLLCCVVLVAALGPAAAFATRVGGTGLPWRSAVNASVPAAYHAAVLPPDAYEPDNSRPSAQIVTDTALPLTQDRVIGSASPSSPDWDYYKIIGTANKVYYFETSGTADTMMEVRDGVTNELLGWNDDKDPPTSFGSELHWRCPANGKSVYVRIGPANSSTGAGTYQMHIRSQVATHRTGFVYRLWGVNKYAAAVTMARDSYAGDWHYFDGGWHNVAHVWVVSDVADAQTSAMCIQPLASIYPGPVLLVARNTLPSATSSAIKAIRSNNGGKVRIHVIGPTSWISTSVYNKLKGLRGTGGSIERISAGDRYAVAGKIADRVDSAWVNNMGVHAAVVIAANGSSGGAQTDLLVASGLGYRAGWPILLTRIKSTPSPTTSRIATKFKKSKVYVPNATTYMSWGTYKKVSGDVRMSSHGDRAKSALDIARYELSRHWFTHEDVVVVNRISEAPTLGTYTGMYGSVLLVSGPNGPYSTTRSYFTARPGMILYVGMAGSTAGITNAAFGAYEAVGQ